jgi:octaprenyl-diphosphate synthase
MSGTSPTLETELFSLARIQGPVSDRLEEVLDDLKRIVVADFEMIEEVNDYLMLMRGKLFRPTLLLLSSQVEGHRSERATTLGAVVELVHLATLVHDDAVDHSVLRRGHPTVNALFTHQIAVIMGDYLYSRAVMELARLDDLDSIRILGKAANEMSVGEMRQLAAYDALDFSEQDYYRLISSKTASLMAAACEMGALAGAAARRGALAEYGENLGMAFQIADDILDYTGQESDTGKPVGQDLRERKVTLPLVGALAEASEAELAVVRGFFSSSEASDESIAQIVGIVEERGGVEFARSKAEEYAGMAYAALDGLPEGSSVESLRGAVEYAVRRIR